MSTPTRLKRGSFARDTRTGQVVKITEQDGRDWMVKTAYKSDGYWVDRKDLTPAADPHAWGGKQLVLFLIALVVSSLNAYGEFNFLTDHGLSFGDAVVYTLPTGVTTWIVLSWWFKLARS